MEIFTARIYMSRGIKWKYKEKQNYSSTNKCSKTY